MKEHVYIKENGLDMRAVQTFRKLSLEKDVDFVWDNAIKQITYTPSGLRKMNRQFEVAAAAEPETQVEDSPKIEEVIGTFVGRSPAGEMIKVEMPDTRVLRVADPDRIVVGGYRPKVALAKDDKEADGYRLLRVVV